MYGTGNAIKSKVGQNNYDEIIARSISCGCSHKSFEKWCGEAEERSKTVSNPIILDTKSISLKYVPNDSGLGAEYHFLDKNREFDKLLLLPPTSSYQIGAFHASPALGQRLPISDSAFRWHDALARTPRFPPRGRRRGDSRSVGERTRASRLRGDADDAGREFRAGAETVQAGAPAGQRLLAAHGPHERQADTDRNPEQR